MTQPVFNRLPENSPLCSNHYPNDVHKSLLIVAGYNPGRYLLYIYHKITFFEWSRRYTLFWHSFWHTIWKYVWHIFWHFILHLFRHSFWHALSGILTGIPFGILCGTLSGILTGIPFGILSGILFYLTFSIWSIWPSLSDILYLAF